jgi:hypothetical protein
MLEPNILVTVLAGLVPLVMGFIWYNPKVMGKAWMKSAGLDEEKMKGVNVFKLFGLTILFSMMLAFILNPIVIHQFGLASVIMGEPGVMEPQPGSPAMMWYDDAMAKYGHTFRTFKHGAFHGTIAAIFFALPVLGINALFERKSGRYIMIHLGYWIITMALMGGIICQWT